MLSINVSNMHFCSAAKTYMHANLDANAMVKDVLDLYTFKKVYVQRFIYVRTYVQQWNFQKASAVQLCKYWLLPRVLNSCMPELFSSIEFMLYIVWLYKSYKLYQIQMYWIKVTAFSQKLGWLSITYTSKTFDYWHIYLQCYWHHQYSYYTIVIGTGNMLFVITNILARIRN